MLKQSKIIIKSWQAFAGIHTEATWCSSFSMDTSKSFSWFNNDLTLFLALPVLFFMYTDKDSNLISKMWMLSPHGKGAISRCFPNSNLGQDHCTTLLSALCWESGPIDLNRGHSVDNQLKTHLLILTLSFGSTQECHKTVTDAWVVGYTCTGMHWITFELWVKPYAPSESETGNPLPMCKCPFISF